MGKIITIPVNKDSHVTGVITILVKNSLELHKPEMNNVQKKSTDNILRKFRKNLSISKQKIMF